MALISLLALAVILVIVAVLGTIGRPGHGLGGEPIPRRDVLLLGLVLLLVSVLETVVFLVEGGSGNLVLMLMGLAFLAWYVQLLIRRPGSGK